MKDGTPRQLRLDVTAALVLALLAAPGLAGAQVRWLVPAEQDVEPWDAAVAETWPDGALVVEVWTGTWPPDAVEVAGAHAFVEDLGAHGLVHLRDGAGGEVTLPVEGDHRESAHARASTLLVLRGLASPLGIADHGWRPPPRPLPAEQVPLPVRGGVEPPLTPSPFDIGLAAGLSGRPGLDSPVLALCVAPRWRLSPGRGASAHLAFDVAADLSGRVDVGDVPVRLGSLGAGHVP